MEKKCWNTFVNHCTVFFVDLLLDFMLFFLWLIVAWRDVCRCRSIRMYFLRHFIYF